MKGVNLRALARSFFIETLWNYEKMQSAGFVFCLYPALSRLYPDQGERSKAVARHQSHVNTHPVMGPLLAGISARLEADLEPNVILPNRWRVMCVLAAIGDRVFWGHLKPLAAVFGTFVALWFAGSFAGCLILLGIYNIPQFMVRALGFRTGWKRGLDSLGFLRPPRIDEVLKGVSGLTALVLGMIAGLLLVLASKSSGSLPELSWHATSGLGLLIWAGLGFFLLRLKASLTVVIYCAIVTVFVSGVAVFSGT